MFNNQENIYHENAYLVLYEEWKKDNEPSRRKGYLDGRFFHYTGLQYRDNDKYKKEFYEMIDLLVRKNMTSHKFIRHNDETKADMYSRAIWKINEYLFNKFDEKKGSLFVYATSTVTSAFWDVIRESATQDKLKKKLANELRGVQDTAIGIDSDQLEIFKDKGEEYSENIFIIDESKEVIEDILSAYKSKYSFKTNLRLIEDDKAPKFKIQYLTFQNVLMFKDSDERKHNKGVVIEYFDTRIFNERCGTRPSYFKNQALIARKNGYQYFGIYSDMLNSDMKQAVLERLNNLIMQTEYKDEEYSDEDKVKQLQFDYILFDDLKDENIIDKFWWGLEDEYTLRLAMVNNTLEEYQRFLKDSKNATRVYSYGRIKIK